MLRMWAGSKGEKTTKGQAELMALGEKQENDTSACEPTVLSEWELQQSSTAQTHACSVYNLKRWELLDYFRDGVNGLCIREKGVGDGGDNVKGTLQKLPRMCTIQLPGTEHALDAVPWGKYKKLTVTVHLLYMTSQKKNSTFDILGYPLGCLRVNLLPQNCLSEFYWSKSQV